MQPIPQAILISSPMRLIDIIEQPRTPPLDEEFINALPPAPKQEGKANLHRYVASAFSTPHMHNRSIKHVRGESMFPLKEDKE